MRSALLLLIAACAIAAPVGGNDTPAPPKRWPVELRLPKDARYLPAGDEAEPVVFRHATHFPAAERRCDGCHTGLFKMLAAAGKTSHAEMEAGRSCGSCHDGKRAFGLKDLESCETCHTGDQPGAGGPKDALFPATEDSPGPVTFRHSTHGTRAGLACSTCHTALFARKVGTAGQDPSALHGEKACGFCHDGKKAFAVNDMDRCQRCHQEAEAGL
jgi:c(7)-type cytochrome triheme protein